MKILCAIFFIIIVLESLAVISTRRQLKVQTATLDARNKTLVEYALIIDTRNHLLEKLTGTNDYSKQIIIANTPKVVPTPIIEYKTQYVTQTIQDTQKTDDLQKKVNILKQGYQGNSTNCIMAGGVPTSAGCL